MSQSSALQKTFMRASTRSTAMPPGVRQAASAVGTLRLAEAPSDPTMRRSWSTTNGTPRRVEDDIMAITEENEGAIIGAMARGPRGSRATAVPLGWAGSPVTTRLDGSGRGYRGNPPCKNQGLFSLAKPAQSHIICHLRGFPAIFSLKTAGPGRSLGIRDGCRWACPGRP